MKVLAPGRPQKVWTTETTCTGAGNGNGGCGARLLVGQTDLFTTFSSYMGRFSTSYVTFRCPSCGTNTDLANTDNRSGVPPHVWEGLPKGVRHPAHGWQHPNEAQN